VRTKLRLYATALALAALAVLIVASPVASAHDNGKGKGKSSLRVVARESQTEFVDVGDEGPSLGDQTVFSETLYVRGRDVGMSGGVCTVTEAIPPYDTLTLQCVVTLSLRKGQITLQGLIESQGEDDPGPFTLAITGGTGAYSDAGGEARFRRVNERRGVYKLRFDDGKKKGHHRY
jgi:hypothetical protein